MGAVAQPEMSIKYYDIASSFLQKMMAGMAEHVRDHYRYVFPSIMALPIQQKRIDIIQMRIHALAWILAIGTPLWSLLDALAFPADLWRSLLVARLLAGAAFASFLLIGGLTLEKGIRSLRLIYLQLAVIFIIPTFFYWFCRQLPEPVFELSPFSIAVKHSYYLLPFVLMACIGLFPLTLLESLGIAMPLLAIYYVSGETPSLVLASNGLGMAWIMVMLTAIAVVVSYSQLRLLTQLVVYSSYDMLTNCLGRRSGEEIVKTLWHYSVRKKSNFSVAFIDLDHFKLVNDSFGHHAGDAVLANTAAAVKQALRKSDFVIRWGGEEFLVIMPDASIDSATNVLVRMAEKGFGARPDGSAQTVSIGIAERLNDAAADEKLLIQIADERLYDAKISGRCRAVGAKKILLK